MRASNVVKRREYVLNEESIGVIKKMKADTQRPEIVVGQLQSSIMNFQTLPRESFKLMEALQKKQK